MIVNGVLIVYMDKDGNVQMFDVDCLIVLVGCVLNIDNFGFEVIGLKVNECGFIDVDDYCCMVVLNVYVIGDVVCGLMFVYKVEDEGVLVVEVIDGQKLYIDYNCILWVIYMYLEIVWVGKMEQQLKVEGCEIKMGKFLFLINGCVFGMNVLDGFVKMIVDVKIDELFGVYVIVVNVLDLIVEVVVVMEFKVVLEDIVCICYLYLLMLEVMCEVVFVVDKCLLNS